MTFLFALQNVDIGLIQLHIYNQVHKNPDDHYDPSIVSKSRINQKCTS